MPGKLVHTNELTVLLGDNWFAKCSAKQAHMLVEHRKKRELIFILSCTLIFILLCLTVKRLLIVLFYGRRGMACCGFYFQM